MKSISKNDLFIENLKGNIKSVKTIKTKFSIADDIIISNNYSYEYEAIVHSFFKKNGYLRKVLTYDSNKLLVFKSLWYYNKKGERIKNNVFCFTGDYFTKSKYKYKENGNVTEDVNDWNITYKFNEKGYLIYEIWRGKSIKEVKVEYSHKYDKNDNVIEWIHHDNFIFSKITYDYDTNNNLKEENSVCPEGKIFETKTYNYILDKMGNWIKKIEYVFESGIKTEKNIYERIIEMY